MPISVIGAGLGRTGTLSLKLALEELGFGPCHHMIEVFKNKSWSYWDDAAEGKPVDWEQALAGYGSTVDWPSATFYRQLADAYPAAKVVLTERDPEAWFASTQATIFAQGFSEASENPWERMAAKAVGRMFDHRLHDHDHAIAVFRRHNAEVRRLIAPERLLVYEVAQGWEPLCTFLGVAEPAQPMPRVNTREDFQKMRETLLEEPPPAQPA